MRVCVQRFSLLWIFAGTLTSVSPQSKTIDLSSTPDSHSHVIELSPFPDSQTKRLTVDDVIKMSKAKVRDDVIIQQLKKEGQYFNLTTDQLLQLKTAHVSKQVIQVMIDPYPVTDSPPSPSEKTAGPKAAASNTAALNADFQHFRQCMQGCNQDYERCRAKAHAKVPDICTSNDDRCAYVVKQLDAEDHACTIEVQKCNAGCQKP
jgi:hypothetical protein